MTTSTSQDTDSSVRDSLALERTRLANERTLLAYARTAIMLVATGGTILKFWGHSAPALFSGWLLIGLGILFFLIGGRRFHHIHQRLAGDRPH